MSSSMLQKMIREQTVAAVLAIVTVPAFAGTRADASLSLGCQAAEPDVIWQEKR